MSVSHKNWILAPFGKNYRLGMTLVQMLIAIAIFGFLSLVAATTLFNANQVSLRGRADLDAQRDVRLLSRIFKRHFMIKKGGGHQECGTWTAADSFCAIRSQCLVGAPAVFAACKDIQIWTGQWNPLPVVGTKSQRIRYQTECVSAPIPVNTLVFPSECDHGCPVGQRPRVKVSFSNFPPPDMIQYYPGQSGGVGLQRAQQSNIGAELCLDYSPGLVSINVGTYSLGQNGQIKRHRHVFTLPEVTVPNGRVQIFPN